MHRYWGLGIQCFFEVVTGGGAGRRVQSNPQLPFLTGRADINSIIDHGIFCCTEQISQPCITQPSRMNCKGTRGSTSGDST